MLFEFIIVVDYSILQSKVLSLGRLQAKFKILYIIQYICGSTLIYLYNYIYKVGKLDSLLNIDNVKNVYVYSSSWVVRVRLANAYKDDVSVIYLDWF